MDTETVNPKKRTGISTILAIIILALLSIALLVGLYFLLTKQSSDVTIKNGDSVITQIRTLSRYESSEFTVEKIIEAGSGNDNAFKEVLFGDKILLIANGKVTAGFDFSKLNENDIKIERSSITLSLPAPEILTARLDNEKTRVYDRQQGLLTQGNKDLETEARLSAENSIRIAACEGGILQSATDNAREQLTALIKALGYTTVVITIPTGNC
jgi:hypothetical protein